jgi:hypothetical protein
MAIFKPKPSLLYFLPGLICVETPEPNISSLGPLALLIDKLLRQQGFKVPELRKSTPLAKSNTESNSAASPKRNSDMAS